MSGGETRHKQERQDIDKCIDKLIPPPHTQFTIVPDFTVPPPKTSYDMLTKEEKGALLEQNTLVLRRKQSVMHMD